MRNDEAAIIALCRSKSQNLSGIPLDRDGYVSWNLKFQLNLLRVYYQARTLGPGFCLSRL